MFGIGETELLIIVAFGFMIFGPDKLPGMGRTIGRALRQFRQAQEGFTEVVQTEVMDPLQDAMNGDLDGGTRQQRRASAEERAAALAQDADIEGPAPQAAARKETFAERKARLAAEREAREAEELARAQAADADADDSAQPAEVSEEAPAAEPEPAKPDTSAAALYSMGGRSSFAAAKQQAAEEAAEEAAEKAAAAEAEKAAEKEAAAQPEQASAAEPEQDAKPEQAATDEGKEAESAQA